MDQAVCPNCGKTYYIPKERLPRSKIMVFPCLGCKKPITYDQQHCAPEHPTATPKQASKRFRKYGKERLQTGKPLKKKILRTLDNLPPMSQVVSEALDIIADPESDLKKLATVIETDQSLTSNVLRLVNSAYYGVRGTVSSIHKACIVLGKRPLQEILVMSGVSNLMGRTLKGYGLASGELWTHSIASAIGSKYIAERGNPEKIDDAYLAGLIHDIGKIILDQYVQEKKDIFEEHMNNGTKTLIEAERDILGFDHAQIAAAVCRKWNFPQHIGSAVRHHHHPAASKRDALSYIVHMADMLAKISLSGDQKDEPAQHLDEGTANFLSLNRKDIHHIISELVNSLKSIEVGNQH